MTRLVYLHWVRWIRVFVSPLHVVPFDFGRPQDYRVHVDIVKSGQAYEDLTEVGAQHKCRPIRDTNMPGMPIRRDDLIP